MAEDTYIKQILDHIIDIKEDLGGLNQNYTNLNLQVIKNTKKIDKTEQTMSKWMGGISVVVVVISLLANYLFK